MMRALFAACCLVGVVLGGAFAPAAGIATPIPDLGVDGEGGPDVGGGLGGGGSPGSGGSLGQGGESGVGSFGGVSGGGYPESATVGGELELSNREELVVESPRPSRWRLGAYATYTGDGWDRDGGDRRPLGDRAIQTATGETPRDDYQIRVTPKREIEALATAWRPAYASAPGRQVYVDEERGLTVDDPVTAGEQYVTVSYGPPSREAAAAVEDGSYPPEVARYTELPDDTPDRLAEKADEITADAETPYEKARAVERWLESEKAYSLEASHDRDRDVATQFVFEMDEGYCQYFATSMAAMLRTQDVPARYVTGYGPGERVGDDRYLVRGSDAHAWVEVYIDGVGWVPFDPTPPDGRQQAGRDGGPAQQLEDVETDAVFDGEGDPSDSTDDGRTTDGQRDDGRTNDERSDDATASVDVQLDSDPVPGREVTATVTRGGEPVAHATVLFNGDPIGETDGAGQVVGEVPYNRSLEISVPKVDGSARLAGVGTGGRYASVPPPRRYAAQDTTVRFEVPTEIEVEVRGDPVAGESVDVVATIDGEPVRDGEVRVDERSVARTDDDGRVTVPLPDADTAELVVERGEARGNATLELTRPDDAADDEELDVSVSPSLPVALPGSTAEVAVTDQDGQPVSDASVAVDGEPVGRTGPDGTFDLRLPFSLSGTTDVLAWLGGGSGGAGGGGGGEYGGAGSAGSMGGPTSPASAAPSGSATVDGLNRNLGAVAAVGAVLVAGLLAVAYRRGLTPRVLAALVRRAAVGTIRYVVAGIVGLGGVLDHGLARLVEWGRRVVGLLGRGVEGARELVESVRAGAASVVGRVVAALRDLPRRLHPDKVLAWLAGLRASATASVAAAKAEALGVEDDASADADAVPTVREAWAEFRTYVTVRSWDTSTPGEIARWAVVRDGLPDEAVKALRDAFREVEYGARSHEDRAPAAQEALERIRASRREEGGEQS